jgi:hypothetical protein
VPKDVGVEISIQGRWKIVRVAGQFGFEISDLRFLIPDFEIPSGTESRNRGLEILNPKSQIRTDQHPLMISHFPN